MAEKTAIAVVTLLTMLIVAAVSFGLAAAGEPQSLWLWKDILRVL